jgi:hypothetical protein
MCCHSKDKHEHDHEHKTMTHAHDGMSTASLPFAIRSVEPEGESAANSFGLFAALRA